MSCIATCFTGPTCVFSSFFLLWCKELWEATDSLKAQLLLTSSSVGWRDSMSWWCSLLRSWPKKKEQDHGAHAMACYIPIAWRLDRHSKTRESAWTDAAQRVGAYEHGPPGQGSTFRSDFAEISVFFSFSLVTGKRNFGIFRFQI